MYNLKLILAVLLIVVLLFSGNAENNWGGAESPEAAVEKYIEYMKKGDIESAFDMTAAAPWLRLMIKLNPEQTEGISYEEIKEEYFSSLETTSGFDLNDIEFEIDIDYEIKGIRPMSEDDLKNTFLAEGLSIDENILPVSLILEGVYVTVDSYGYGEDEIGVIKYKGRWYID